MGMPNGFIPPMGMMYPGQVNSTPNVFGGFPMMGANLQNPGAPKRNESDKWWSNENRHLLFYKKHNETTDPNVPPLLCYSTLIPKKCSSLILMNQDFKVH